MSSTSYIDLAAAGIVISGTGNQAGLKTPERGRNFVAVALCGTAGTSITLNLQHSADNSTFSTQLAIGTITATGQTATHIVSTGVYQSLLPFCRLNVSAVTGSFTFTFIRLYFELF